MKTVVWMEEKRYSIRILHKDNRTRLLAIKFFEENRMHELVGSEGKNGVDENINVCVCYKNRE